MKKAIIFGGYGNFGKILSRSFLKDKIPIVLCGRNSNKLYSELQKLNQEFGSQAMVQASIKDINDDISQFLIQQKPSVLINTCGPFQTANYRVVETCINAGVDYIDLADGRDFVINMKQFDQQARKKQVTVISGASSVPGLSSAIIQKYRNEFQSIQSLRYGISPGQKTTRGGIATVKGVLGYVGKQIKPYGNEKKPIYGWQDLYTQKYPLLGDRLFGNCEVPDLDLFPEIYGIKDLRFSAGMESKILHLGIWMTSWLIRLGIPINLPKYAEELLNFSHWGFDWIGTDKGGMHMIIQGTNKTGQRIQRKWYIIIGKGHGPNVPVMPAIILGKKIAKNELKLSGVHPCVGLVTLDEYLQQLSVFDTKVFTQIVPIK